MFADENGQIAFIFENSRLLSMFYFFENEYFLCI